MDSDGQSRWQPYARKDLEPDAGMFQVEPGVPAMLCGTGPDGPGDGSAGGEVVGRINCSDEEYYPGQFGLWQANCRRSLRSKAGQEELRVLRDSLLALPDKRLIHGLLVDEEGKVCAVGAYAKHQGLDLQKFDPEDRTDDVGIEAGMPALVAWKVVEMNDMEFSHLTPEDRYKKMLEWVAAQLMAEVRP